MVINTGFKGFPSRAELHFAWRREDGRRVQIEKLMEEKSRGKDREREREGRPASKHVLQTFW